MINIREIVLGLIVKTPFKYHITSALLILSLTSNSTAQKRVLCLSWNVESGENHQDTIAKRLSEFEGYDIMGLTEVKARNADLYSQAASVGEGAGNSSSPDFKYALGSTGGNDRMMIIWDNKRFEKIGEAQELSQLNEGRHRAPLFAKFKIRNTEIEFIFMVNHLARGNSDLRDKQAQGLVEWAKEQTVPVISVGDYNFDFDIDEGVGNKGFNNMINDSVWIWLKPKRLYQTQFSPKYNSVLDFVFVANMPTNWEGYSTIILSHPSVDNEAESDHRPVEAHFYINP